MRRHRAWGTCVSRPDPFQVKRRPMARAGSDFAFARGRQDGAERPVFTDEGALDVDGLQRLVGLAESVIEGQGDSEEGGARFYGSAVLTLATAEPDAGRVAVAITTDARARKVVRDRVYRELARLLGPDTPVEFEMNVRAAAQQGAVRVDVDIEAPLPVVDQSL